MSPNKYNKPEKWYKKGKFTTLALLIMIMFVVIKFVATLGITMVQALLGPAGAILVLPIPMIVCVFLLVLVPLIVRRRGTMMVLAIPEGLLFALGPAITGFPHPIKFLIVLYVHAVMELMLISYAFSEKKASIAAGMIFGINMYLTVGFILWVLNIPAYAQVAPLMIYGIPLGMVLGGLSGFAAYKVYNDNLKNSALIRRIRAWE